MAENDEMILIDAYSRQQAVEDGVLVDMDTADFGNGETGNTLRKQAGIKLPIAFTSTLFARINPNKEQIKNGQSLLGRYWDVLNVFRFMSKAHKETDQFIFTVSVSRRNVQVKVVVSGGDDGEPVLTFMFPDED
jgi:hypothetical protein